MYYYILAEKLTAAEQTRLNGLKTLLANLGIAGEFNQISPLRRAKDQIELALARKFNSIIAVGDDGHLNQVAGLVGLAQAGSFGAIPLGHNPRYEQFFGKTTIPDACQLLLKRPIKQIDWLELNSEAGCYDTVEMRTVNPVEFCLSYTDSLLADQDWQITGQLSRARIEVNARVTIYPPQTGARGWRLPWQRQSTAGDGRHEQTTVSQVTVDRCQLMTDPALATWHLDTQLTTLPLTLKFHPLGLKIIASHDITGPRPNI
ncbi:MAG: Diacylglycerol kinase catalytic region [Candidatus Berkelbacteria bacterium Gr01-1014_85]|uniref:Diacylglycerol kinase catalytic region n=1 Tax=Candidatus Berkelbacteria bacterium Gr01-1014_85 TaxID=2017150 RepID=A0A554JBX6_9BACT|nr:MAG: Diacylglycerol kinase catalytic region [Candidatus Berkelbacteria bacterium Gr01-1014_85]